MDRKIQADLSLMFCSLIWGVTFVVVKNGLDHASPFVFLAVRFTIAAALMAVFRPRVLGRIEREEVFAGMRLAFFMFAGYCFQTAGLQYTTATNSGFVTGSSVVFVPLLLGVFWGRSLTRWIYVGAFAALVGLYFLTVPAEGLRYLNRGDVFPPCSRGVLRRAHHFGRRVLAGTLRLRAQFDSGGWLRIDGLAADGLRRGNPLATGALCLGLAAIRLNSNLRGVRNRRGIHRATMGAAIHLAGPRRDSVCSRAGVRGDHVLPVAPRTLEPARLERRRAGRCWNCARGIIGRTGSAGSSRTHLRRTNLFQAVVAIKMTCSSPPRGVRSSITLATNPTKGKVCLVVELARVVMETLRPRRPELVSTGFGWRKLPTRPCRFLLKTDN
jgi:hypothetical protein